MYKVRREVVLAAHELLYVKYDSEPEPIRSLGFGDEYAIEDKTHP